jgi:hypothetical protein
MTTGDAEPPVPYNITLALKGKIMNDGVKILLERMQTHPEEFVVAEGIPAKWDHLIRSYEAILDSEDIALFKQARAKLLQQQFTEKVMEELIDPKKSSLEDVINQYRVKGMPSVGQIPMPSTITLEHSEHLRAHLDALKREVDNQKPKEHKTIFGKLFNYQ